MKIDQPIIEAFYDYAVKLQNGDITYTEAKNGLAEQGITSSINFYLYIYPNLLEGRIFKGTINAPATEYYLEKILETHGLNGLQKALQSLSLHIDYYEGIQNSNMLSLKRILNEFIMKYNLKYDSYFEEHIDKKAKLKEGLTKQITVNIYERNPIARAKCIDHFGAICRVCEFDFEKKFGDLGKGFIHIHHIIDISTIKEEYIVDYIKDLVPVCPNCHAMLHKKKPAYKIEELKSIML